MGRNDDQVKIRGFRIELGEIEARLAAHAGVRRGGGGGAGGCAGRQAAGGVLHARRQERTRGSEAGGGGCGSMLRRRLPEYMVPAAYVRLEGCR